MHDLFVEPSRVHAHVILAGGGHNVVAVEALVDRIVALLGT